MNYNSEEFQKTESYKQFKDSNPSEGYLKIRAYAASGAIPISNMQITISKMIDNTKIIFFSGMTNSSGIIERITLPAPKLNQNNLDMPTATTYDIKAIYNPDNIDETYKVNIYENIYVIQNISVVPKLNVMAGGN